MTRTKSRTKGFSSFPLHTVAVIQLCSNRTCRSKQFVLRATTGIHTWAIFSLSALAASGAWVSRTGSSSGEIWSSLMNVWSQICRIKETSLRCRIREMLIANWLAVHGAVLFISRLRFALWPLSCIRLRVGQGELCDITQQQSELSRFLNRTFINVLTFSAPRKDVSLWASCPTKVSFTLFLAALFFTAALWTVLAVKTDSLTHLRG